MTDNPVHEVGGPQTAWTIVNTAENFPGVATPLGWTFWRDPLERGMKASFFSMGVLPRSAVTVPESVDDRFSAAVYGRFAANVDCLRAMADLIPGTSGDALEEQLLGSVRPGVSTESSARRYPAIAMKMPATVVRLPKRLRSLRKSIDSWWRRVTRPGAITSVEQAKAILLESASRFEEVMAPHSVVTLLSTGLYDQVKALAAAAGHPGLETSLITGYGEVEETEAIDALWRVSRDEISLDRFLDDHGYHAPSEAEIASVAWREDRAPLERLVQQYRVLGSESSPQLRAATQHQARLDAESRVRAALAGPSRVKATLILRTAKRYIPLREVGKAAFLQTIDGARAAARFLGNHWAGVGVLDQPDDVYYLTFDELTIRLPDSPRSIVADRRTLHTQYEQMSLPDQWIGSPDPSCGTMHDLARSVSGMPVSPGVVEGIARVIDQGHSQDLDDGEILVCKTTDPSWASFFLVAGAVVIDIGGPLSHGAIVAREIGIPCVINTGNGTKVIKSGDRVRVDGSSGEVTIIERPPTAPKQR